MLLDSQSVILHSAENTMHHPVSLHVNPNQIKKKEKKISFLMTSEILILTVNSSPNLRTRSVETGCRGLCDLDSDT